MVFKKCRENPEDILFIDASQYFEKIKTQNVLRASDIDKIIETYRKRKEEEKYSKKVSLKLISENNYNLNIPRYVNTFEAEKTIDIEAIAQELKALESEIKKADSAVATFCKELKISTPF